MAENQEEVMQSLFGEDSDGGSVEASQEDTDQQTDVRSPRAAAEGDSESAAIGELGVDEGGERVGDISRASGTDSGSENEDKAAGEEDDAGAEGNIRANDVKKSVFGSSDEEGEEAEGEGRRGVERRGMGFGGRDEESGGDAEAVNKAVFGESDDEEEEERGDGDERHDSERIRRDASKSDNEKQPREEAELEDEMPGTPMGVEEEEEDEDRGAFTEADDARDRDGLYTQTESRPVAPPLDLDLPLMPPPAPSNRMKLVLASNVLGIEMAEFDPDTYEAEDANLVQNVARWRKAYNPDGTSRIESNARIVKWSDGSMQLFLGSEALAADCFPMTKDNASLFLHHTGVGDKSSALQSQGRLLEKIRFRPADTSSKIHKKLTLGLESKYKKKEGVREYVAMVDPEKDLDQGKQLRKDIKQWERSQQKIQQQAERMARTKAVNSAPESWQHGGARERQQRWFSRERDDDEDEEVEYDEEEEDGGPARSRGQKLHRSSRGREEGEEEEGDEEDEEEMDEEDDDDDEEEEEAVDTEDEAEEEGEGAQKVEDKARKGDGIKRKGGSRDDAGGKRARESSPARDDYRTKKKDSSDGVGERRQDEGAWTSDHQNDAEEVDDNRKGGGNRRRVLVDSDDEE